MSYFDYQDFADDCFTFNRIAGKDKGITLSEIKEQYKLIHEEVKEIEEGIELNDPEEVLDGAIDTLVTVLGLLQKLENAGFDIEKALVKTASNNFSKYTPNEEVALDSFDFYEKKGIPVTVTYNGNHDVYVIKDSSNKVRKPVDFVSNDLKDCVPEQYLTDGFSL